MTFPNPLPAILALDPGGTTGWCYYEPFENEFKVETGEIANLEHHQELFTFLAHKVDSRIALTIHIVCERFEHRQSDSDRPKIEYISAEYVGVTKLLAQTHRRSNVKLVLQSAAQVKGKDKDGHNNVFFNDVRLKQLGLWIPGKRHAMDATRHYLYYRTFTLKDRAVYSRLRNV